MPQTIVRVFRDASGVVPLQDWFDELQASDLRAYRKCRARIIVLEQLGNELRRPLADLLRDGIRELRIRVGTVNYRILYFFMGETIVCLSHGITKEGKVPDADIDMAVKRKKLVENDRERYTTEWEV